MSYKQTCARLKREVIDIKKNLDPLITAVPLEHNLFEWHYVINGPKDSPYEGGYYHGKILFPLDFPFHPPAIYMITPNGRFRTNTRLCLTMSDYHPETWNPTWSVGSILTGLLSFMLENTATVGSTDSTDQQKRQLAARSVEFNLKDKLFCELFPDLVIKFKEDPEITQTKMPPPKTNNSRLKQDYVSLKKDPLPYIVAEPLPANILEWHYVITGPKDSPYEGGFYHGKLIFPKEFPFKPPAIYMITPNGRFRPNTKLCLTMSDYHPETWNPAWSVGTILTGLLSFMLENTATVGSIDMPDHFKKQMAARSVDFNLKDKLFCELFPDLVIKLKVLLCKGA